MSLLLYAIIGQSHWRNPKDPHFEGHSRRVVHAMEAALNRLSGCTVSIKSDNEIVKISLQGKHIREEQQFIAWAHDGHTLTIRDAVNRRFYSGRCARNHAVDYVAKSTHHRVDPFSRDILVHTTPLMDGIWNTSVRSAEVEIKGFAYDVVVAQNPAQRTTYLVRRSDHLPVRVTSETLLNRSTIAEHTRYLAYHPMQFSSFALSPGPRDKKLPLVR